MLNPKEVHQRRQAAIRYRQDQRQAKLREESKKVFQWILKIIDENTTKGLFGSICVWQYDGSNCIIFGGEEFQNCNFPRAELFPDICEVINSEEGFCAEYEKDVEISNKNAWKLKVTVIVV